jgi:hypothetical protein
MAEHHGEADIDGGVPAARRARRRERKFGPSAATGSASPRRRRADTAHRRFELAHGALSSCRSSHAMPGVSAGGEILWWSQ